MRTWFALLLFFLSVPSGAARADETEPLHDREVEEVAYRAERSDDEEPLASLFATVDVGARVVSPARQDVVAMLTVGGTFGAGTSPAQEPTAEALDDAPSTATLLPLGPVIDVTQWARLGSETVRRAQVRAVPEADFARLDDLSSRARWSALLPELRLRLARVVDEDRALSPTEYDPARVTTGNQESFWIEGRAAFRLDRLVFASEEVALERLRFDRQREARRAELEAISWLRRYAHADAVVRSPTTPPSEVATAELERAEASITLDALTGGWFSAAAARDASKAEAAEPGSSE